MCEHTVRQRFVDTEENDEKRQPDACISQLHPISHVNSINRGRFSFLLCKMNKINVNFADDIKTSYVCFFDFPERFGVCCGLHVDLSGTVVKKNAINYKQV